MNFRENRAKLFYAKVCENIHSVTRIIFECVKPAGGQLMANNMSLLYAFTNVCD